MQNGDQGRSSGSGDRPVERKLIGMLTPSSNTVLEPYTTHMLEPLFPSVTAHFARFRVTQIALDETANGQFALAPIMAAAELLADAKCDVIAWNGTSASWLGFDSDERLCDAITAKTGIAATSAILSLNALLAKLHVKRLGLVTPYTDDVQARIVQNYASIGIDVCAEAHSGLSENFSFADVGEDAIEAMCQDVAAARPDAIAIVCTNMRGPLIAAKLERRLGIPVLDSVAFTLWGCLAAVGVGPAPLSAFGSIFGPDAR
ncbi:maleate cis-trans isomerase family protein [Jiella pelagia]|uniref:Aspartate/glutamate racemase family protein n=1 Tax=Jiella pelagia TaxID=2986949 RepID=A0ABY7BWH1_9HYPH|nr:aspartate/glutamate racemase family protein [Jiella pelagia]WAP67811.1 aspartate/glutamate racemase family protein [Jiella pelagia]